MKCVDRSIAKLHQMARFIFRASIHTNHYIHKVDTQQNKGVRHKAHGLDIACRSSSSGPCDDWISQRHPLSNTASDKTLGGRTGRRPQQARIIRGQEQTKSRRDTIGMQIQISWDISWDSPRSEWAIEVQSEFWSTEVVNKMIENDLGKTSTERRFYFVLKSVSAMVPVFAVCNSSAVNVLHKSAVILV